MAGASLTGDNTIARVLVVVRAPAPSELASVTDSVRLRVVRVVSTVGSSLLLENTSDRSTCW